MFVERLDTARYSHNPIHLMLARLPFGQIVYTAQDDLLQEAFIRCDVKVNHVLESDVALSQPAERLCEEVLVRGRYALEIATQNHLLLEIALDNLSLGRARLGLTLATGGSFDQAEDELDRAVHGLREAAQEDDLPRGLLARATLHRFANNPAAAETDLTEALEIAERGQMRLFECDAHLEWGRLCWSVGDREGAKAHLETARRLVAETGYHRRDREVGELAAALGA